MAIVDTIAGLLTNLWFYIILGVMAVTGIGMRYLKKVNLTKKKVLVLSVIGILFASGIVSWAMLGVGSTASVSASSIDIERIQTTTAYTLNNGTAFTDSGVDDTKMSDFYVQDGMAVDGNITTGVFLVTRGGNLDADSCQARVIKPPRFDISDTTYKIVNEDVDTGVMQAWVYTGDTSSAASHTHPKENAVLAFAEGDADEYVSFKIEIDATGFDALSQYSYKDINVDICGYPYTFRVHNSG